MKAFKGFPADMTSRLGDGDYKTCHYEVGESKEVPESKTGRNGFHCCEYPFFCFRHYAFDGENRFFEVDAGGDINEEDGERIACTKLQVIRELSTADLLMEGIQYMVLHPFREWEINSIRCKVTKSTAECSEHGAIVISRGNTPKVTVASDTWCGLIREPEEGDIECARMFHAVHAGTYILLDDKVTRW